MAVTRISRSFKDISLSFEPHPVTKDLPVIKNQTAIIRSIRNLVETIPSEKFFNPNLGSNVYSSLFEFVDYGTASVIEDQIRNVVRNYEPRVERVEVNAYPEPDSNNFEIYVKFNIIGQQFPTQQFSFILEATR
jgi:phage baseplate assembly protein W